MSTKQTKQPVKEVTTPFNHKEKKVFEACGVNEKDVSIKKLEAKLDLPGSISKSEVVEFMEELYSKRALAVMLMYNLG